MKYIIKNENNDLAPYISSIYNQSLMFTQDYSTAISLSSPDMAEQFAAFASEIQPEANFAIYELDLSIRKIQQT